MWQIISWRIKILEIIDKEAPMKCVQKEKF